MALRESGDRAKLSGVRDSVRDPDPHHEVAGRMPSHEDAPPLQALDVAFLNGLPAELRIARDVRADVEAILLGLDLLDLVHSGPPRVPEHKKGALPMPLGRGALASAEPAFGLSRRYP